MTTERANSARQAPDHGAAVALTADGWSRPCRIAEIAPGGAEVRLSGAPPRNREVRLHHPTAGAIYASWIWWENGRLGLAFANLSRARAFIANILVADEPAAGGPSGEQAEILSDAVPLTA